MCDRYTEISGVLHFYSDFVLKTQSSWEVVSTGHALVFNPEVIDYEHERDAVGGVAKEAGHQVRLDIAMFCNVRD